MHFQKHFLLTELDMMAYFPNDQLDLLCKMSHFYQHQVILHHHVIYGVSYDVYCAFYGASSIKMQLLPKQMDQIRLEQMAVHYRHIDVYEGVEDYQ